MKTLALSHSKVNTFETCPRQFKLQYIDKDYPFDSDNPYFVKGQKLHKQLEDYVIAKLSGDDKNIPKLSAASRNAIGMINNLMAKYPDVYPEQQLCIDKNYKKSGWFDNSKAHWRAIIDFLAMSEEYAIVIDYKSGKVRDYAGFGGQLHLTAFMLFMMKPKLQTVISAYLYLEHKQTVKITLTREDLPELKKHFENKWAEINMEEEYAPTRNQYCNYCSARPDQCQYKIKREL
jgi:CRISPR/Cas system-associated exonuclease Cas4 (RecB family)